ncbi:ABC transporter ATP-binding protein [Consotaella aegiceratis]|uniref:ABC transporter ATP-binding protein n=1 Tax=Consotaella aegiceratis TaxID=3097961 RepID=UPI002F3F319F
MSQVELERVRKQFGGVEVIHGVDLTVQEGELCVFVGPSGCGKSTLLRMVAGLEEVSEGEIRIGGKRVNEAEPAQRGVAMVFQSYALYPHMTVRGNMTFGLRTTGTPKAEAERRLMIAADILQLGDFLDRRPSQLSGGQRQRVAIGRAIVREPQVFLFDEPLSNLDAELRVQMRVEIATLHQRLGNTMIYVTHDQTEAMTLADKIVVLRDGRIEQIGAPIDLYENPDNDFVAGFIGSPRMNFIEGTVLADGRIGLPGDVVADVPLAETTLDPGTKVQVGIRPEHFHAPSEGQIQLPVKTEVVERLGGVTYVYGRLPSGQRVVVKQDGVFHSPSGSVNSFGFAPGDVRLFTPEGMRLR